MYRHREHNIPCEAEARVPESETVLAYDLYFEVTQGE